MSEETKQPDMTFPAQKGDTYMIEFKVKEECDLFREEVMQNVFGDTLEKIDVTKFWLRSKERIKDDMLDRVDRMAEDFKYQIEQQFGDLD